jgi:hypothetical protein
VEASESGDTSRLLRFREPLLRLDVVKAMAAELKKKGKFESTRMRKQPGLSEYHPN